MTPFEAVEYILHEDDDMVQPGMTSTQQVVCQHCERHYKDKPCFPGEEGVSHGICPECFPIEMEKIRRHLSALYGREVPAHQPRQAA